MNITDSNITLDTTIKELKKFPYFNRNTLYLLKEFGANNMGDILSINPYAFKEMKDVGPATLNDLFDIQKRYKYLSQQNQEDCAKLLDKAAQICVSFRSA